MEQKCDLECHTEVKSVFFKGETQMEQIWIEMYQAAKEVLKPRRVSSMMEAAGVAAAVEFQRYRGYA